MAGPRGDDAPAATGWEGAIRPHGTRLPDFALRNQDGETVTAAALRGRPAVVTFIYSTCEDTCPAQVQSIRGALDDLGRDVPVIGVSVDPANDTRASAQAFLLEQSMTGRMDFLLGSRAELAPVWKAFGIAPQRDGRDHSSYTVLVDAEGRQRIGFPASQLTPRRLADDLARCTPTFRALRGSLLRGTWRRYQKAAIAAFERDRGGRRRTHIVAPPGSGKTLLGVELVRRIGRRALVLTPNSAVQMQWPRAVRKFAATLDEGNARLHRIARQRFDREHKRSLHKSMDHQSVLIGIDFWDAENGYARNAARMA